MPDISSITLPDNNTYTFKDSVAREAAQDALDRGGVIYIYPDIQWNGVFADGTVREYPYSEILNYIDNNILCVLCIPDPSDDSIFLYPSHDDTADLYFASAIETDYTYYKADIDDSGNISIVKEEFLSVPPFGNVGDVLTKTSSGYAWQSLPASATISQNAQTNVLSIS